jgi:hypothetical protein
VRKQSQPCTFRVISSPGSDTVENERIVLFTGSLSDDAFQPLKLNLARVLLLDNELASRLTLQTILQAGGYSVHVAASPSEALDLLDTGQYELVLSGTAGRAVLSYARLKPYRPATALVTAYHDGGPSRFWDEQQVCIGTDDVSLLLDKVASLISARATRRAERALRQLA